jgi:hypothetical protein
MVILFYLWQKELFFILEYINHGTSSNGHELCQVYSAVNIG